MEQSLVMYRITKPGHRLDMYIGAQPLSNDDGKVTALTIWRWEGEIADNLKEFDIKTDDVSVLSFQKLDDAQAVIDNPNFKDILDAIYKN